MEEYDLWQRRRLSMKPGITCLWQVSAKALGVTPGVKPLLLTTMSHIGDADRIRKITHPFFYPFQPKAVFGKKSASAQDRRSRLL